MKTIDIHVAKGHLSMLVEEAAAGEEIIIAKAGKPMARLLALEKVALEKASFGKALGALKGCIHASDNFDAPLPPDLFNGYGIE